ncbi:MAG: hydrolase TatD [Gammaproteobacteria bacterium CG22_combo_CG10-13_8_21_14_all_40_8]|nr:MAG: hydrolase TatD [Gammaproteobacteria bacterium CG22_combo_CG10-13_8_21_14_all_40_8]
MLVDSHCHLGQIKLTDTMNLDDVLHLARGKGIKGFLSVATDIENAETNYKEQKHHPDVWYSAGIHPLHTKIESDWKTQLAGLVELDQFVAVGETGLDFYYDQASLSQQKQLELFDFHCYLSEQHKKPLIVHTREAKQETVNILKQYNLDQAPGVIHCFTEDWPAAKAFLDLGFYLSFSGIISFKNSQDLRDVLKKVPLERVLVETDSPYLTPMPFRGRSNEPQYVVQVAQAMADVYEIPLEKIAQVTTKNFQQVFKIQLN